MVLHDQELNTTRDAHHDHEQHGIMVDGKIARLLENPATLGVRQRRIFVISCHGHKAAGQEKEKRVVGIGVGQLEPPTRGRRMFDMSKEAYQVLRRATNLQHLSQTKQAMYVTREWDLESDKRKPYTREVVEALQQQIASLEAKIASMSALSASSPSTLAGISPPSAASLQTTDATNDSLAGGLAHNAHGEGPGSAMSVLADAAASSEGLRAARHAALTQAPNPLAIITHEPPPPPPVLPPEVSSRILRNAFEYALPAFCLVDERSFYADMAEYPTSSTQHYSPFMLYILLGIGCRYLDPNEAGFPVEVCSDPSDRSTRGDRFIDYARYILDNEWHFPKLSTLRALASLSLYMVGKRGFDGASWLHIGSATRVGENFGLHLGIHHLSAPEPNVENDVIRSRQETFFAIFGHEVFMSMHIGRNGTFRPDEFDQQPPPVDPLKDFDQPMYRSSALHWAAKLAIIVSKILACVYARRGIGLAARRAEVPALHLELQTWYHALPGHIKVSAADGTKSPHPHIICLNLMYWLSLIHLHRPFFAKVSSDAVQPSSTEKCLLAASHILRLVKVQQKSHGFRVVHPFFMHAAFAAGTILAMSCTQRGISPTMLQDEQRQAQAGKDLRVIITALKEISSTWSAASGVADTLQALTTIPTPGTLTPPVDSKTANAVDSHIDAANDAVSVLDPSILVTDPASNEMHIQLVESLQQQQQQHQVAVTSMGLPVSLTQQSFPCFSEQMFPSWNWGQEDTALEFAMNTMGANNPFSGLPGGNLPW
ncbi:hypothetical protein OIO90_001003 [Microbotryomycetes sp. JL221]|nr:hypothetical protein OIO90_001003 [Microbotryomycetes sp. JL221]